MRLRPQPFLALALGVGIALAWGAGCSGVPKRQAHAPKPRHGRLVDVRSGRGVHVRAPFVNVQVDRPEVSSRVEPPPDLDTASLQ